MLNPNFFTTLLLFHHLKLSASFLLHQCIQPTANNLPIVSGASWLTITDPIHLGLTRAENGVMTWDDGTSVRYNNWDWENGEPSNDATKNCTVVDPTTSKWKLEDCATDFDVICKY